MITPAFELSQDGPFLTVVVRVPYTRTSEFDLFIDGTDFKFYAKPYFLRLTLPGRIVEDGREKATFDIDKGLFTLKVPKESAGEHFEGLQMLTSLLAPKGSRSARPLVEDISIEASGAAGDDDDDEGEDEEEFDWQVEQEVYTESSEAELASLQKYGFGNQRAGVFARLQEELGDVIDVRNPDATTAAERRRARREAEALDFSSDHYLSDLFEDDVVQGLLKYSPWWTALSPSPEQEAAACFTDDEKDQLRRFTNRSYLLDKTSRQAAWLGLVDILLAYAYDQRFTEGEHTVESPWTIRKLSGTLCWLEVSGVVSPRVIPGGINSQLVAQQVAQQYPMPPPPKKERRERSDRSDKDRPDGEGGGADGGGEGRGDGGDGRGDTEGHGDAEGPLQGGEGRPDGEAERPERVVPARPEVETPEKEKSDKDKESPPAIKDKPDREKDISLAITKKPGSKKTRPKSDNHQSPPSDKHSIQSGKSATKTNKSSRISRPKLKNVDRSTAQQLAITVGNVTVIITDFKEKTRSSSTSSSTVTSSSAASEHQHQSSGSECMDKGSSRASTPKGDLSSMGHDESF
ncbi:unnamed protein product [Merluccius merluccius]